MTGHAAATADSYKSVTPRPLPPAQLRRSMGRFATGVTVLTAAEASGAVHAMTANAFTSVSLDPPLVLVSVANSARMLDVISQAGHYAVSLLHEDQEDLARQFAGLSPVALPARFSWWNGIPILPDALARIACSLSRAVVAGDHTLFLGEPRWTATGAGEPLVFYGGAFHAIESSRRSDVWWDWG